MVRTTSSCTFRPIVAVDTMVGVINTAGWRTAGVGVIVGIGRVGVRSNLGSSGGIVPSGVGNGGGSTVPIGVGMLWSCSGTLATTVGVVAGGGTTSQAAS